MQDMTKIGTMFKELGLSEMTVRDGDFEIFLKKDTESPDPIEPSDSHPLKPADEPDEETDALEGTPVTAPLPGVFYQGDSENGEPYVKVGDSVEPDTVVCSIEAMKMLNYVKAGVSGKVKKICASQGDVVGFGQALLVIDRE